MIARSILSVASLLAPLALVGCATNAPAPRVQQVKHVKGIPQPDRWKLFLQSAERGDIEEVPDEPEDSNPFGLVTARRGKTHPVPPGARAVASENFKGKFRREAKTSYSKGRSERVTEIESLVEKLPSDAEMTAKNPQLVRQKNHENHEPRIPLEQHNVTVDAWLYWEGHQRDNDYHLILGDTSELTTKTIFMNAEISGLPTGHAKAQPFAGLRSHLKQLIATNPNKRGAFVTPVPLRVTGSLLWDGEHRNPNNVGPKKPVDIRPKKAWEIHPIHDLQP